MWLSGLSVAPFLWIVSRSEISQLDTPCPAFRRVCKQLWIALEYTSKASRSSSLLMISIPVAFHGFKIPYALLIFSRVISLSESESQSQSQREPDSEKLSGIGFRSTPWSWVLQWVVQKFSLLFHVISFRLSWVYFLFTVPRVRKKNGSHLHDLFCLFFIFANSLILE